MSITPPCWAGWGQPWTMLTQVLCKPTIFTQAREELFWSMFVYALSKGVQSSPGELQLNDRFWGNNVAF